MRRIIHAIAAIVPVRAAPLLAALGISLPAVRQCLRDWVLQPVAHPRTETIIWPHILRIDAQESTASSLNVAFLRAHVSIRPLVGILESDFSAHGLAKGWLGE